MPVVATKTSLDAVVKQYAFPDIHIGAGEDESPCVSFKENVYIRHLAFDVRNNFYANILWVKKGGMLGRHRHRGKVFTCTLEGSWRYLEYDWVARAGSYVQESPGTIHTLVSDDPNGMKTIFWLNGAIEFFDENDNLLETLDVFWFIDHYLTHCPGTTKSPLTPRSNRATERVRRGEVQHEKRLEHSMKLGRLQCAFSHAK